MIIKTTVTALALILVPAMSMAAYNCSARGNQAQSCASGTVWNVAQQTCVQQVNG